MNLVDTIKQQLGPEMLSKLGRVIGEDSQSASAATSAAVPAVLAGLTGAASTPDGAQKLADAVDDFDEQQGQSLAGALGGSGAPSIIDKGSSLLRNLLGGNVLSSLAGALGKHLGLGGSSVSSLLGALAPMILGTLKRVKGSMGLDAGGLGNLLSSQKENIAAAMPAGLSGALANVPGLSSLGLADVGRSAGEAARATGDWARDTGSAAVGAGRKAMAAVGDYGRPRVPGNPLKWLIPLALLLGLGLLLWRFAFNRPRTDAIADRAAQGTRDVRDSASGAVDQAKQTARDAAGATGDAARTASGAIGQAKQDVTDAAQRAGEKTSQAVDSAASSV